MKKPNIHIASNFYKSAKKFLIQIYYSMDRSPDQIWKDLSFMESYSKIVGGVIAIDHLESNDESFVYLIYIEFEDRIHIRNPDLFLLKESIKSVFDTARSKKTILKSLSINYNYKSFGKYVDHKWVKPKVFVSNKGKNIRSFKKL